MLPTLQQFNRNFHRLSTLKLPPRERYKFPQLTDNRPRDDDHGIQSKSHIFTRHLYTLRAPQPSNKVVERLLINSLAIFAKWTGTLAAGFRIFHGTTIPAKFRGSFVGMAVLQDGQHSARFSRMGETGRAEDVKEQG